MGLEKGLNNPNCMGCGLSIESGSIVQFGNGMWHLNCFNCVKCHQLIAPDSNLLLLSDGSPLCSNCSQNCCVCQLPIADEAVMTADQCYHADCFKCKKCDSKIDGSLFARTSQGILCMPCYAERKDMQKKRGLNVNPPLASPKEKSLPSIPVEALFELDGYKNNLTNNNISGGMDLNSPSLNVPPPPLLQPPAFINLPTPSNFDMDNISKPIDPPSPSYTDALKLEVKTLRKKLVDQEFHYAKLKLHSDQISDRIKVFQDEYSGEILRRKGLEQVVQIKNDELKDIKMDYLELQTKYQHLQAKFVALENTLSRNVVNEGNNFNLELSSNISPISTPPNKEIIAEDDLPIRPQLLRSNQATYSQHHFEDSSNSDSIIKTRVSMARRSLDVRTMDSLPKLMNKRTSLDNLLKLGFNPNLSTESDMIDDAKVDKEINEKESNLERSDSLSKDNGDREINGKKKYWRNPFKGGKEVKDTKVNENIKAQISGPVSVPLPPDTKGMVTITSPELPVSPKLSPMLRAPSPLPPLNQTNEIDLYPHQLVAHNYLRPMRCDLCSEKMWGLQSRELRCTACGYHCHTKCASNVGKDCPGLNQPYLSKYDVPTSPNLISNPDPVKSKTNSPDGCLVFGVDLQVQITKDETEIPRVVSECIVAVEHLGLDFEGLYRKGGPQTQMKALRKQIQSLDYNIKDNPQYQDVTVVTSVLKQYFRELPNPLFTFSLHSQLMDIVKDGPKMENLDIVFKISELLKTLPEAHKKCCKSLMDHLYRVSSKSPRNLMTCKNLGVVFGPTLLQSPDPLTDLDDMVLKNQLIEFLLDNWPNMRICLL